MRASFYEGDDTLRPGRMPRSEFAVEFDHRPSVEGFGVRFLCVYLIPLGLTSLVITIFLRMFADDLVGSAVFTVLVVVGLGWALMEFLAWRSMLRVALCAVSGLGIFCLLVLGLATQTVWAGIALWALACALAVVLADQVTTFHARWMLAEPRLDREQRDEWQRQWRLRLQWRPYRLGITVVAVNFVIAAGLVAVATSLEVPHALGLTIAVLAHFAITGAVLVVWNQLLLRRIREHYERELRAPGNPDLPKTCEVVLEALASWTRYDPDPLAPGVLRIPIAGKSGIDPLLRRSAIGLVSAVAAFAVLPVASYFPVSLVFPTPWLSVAQPEDVTEQLRDTKQALREAPSTQRQIANRLGGAERERYAQALAETHNTSVRLRAQDAANLRLLEHLDAGPEAWIGVALRGLASERWVFFVWTCVAAAVLCIAIPGLLMGGVFYLVASAPLLMIYVHQCLRTLPAEPLRTRKTPSGEGFASDRFGSDDKFGYEAHALYRQRPRTRWDDYVSRIQSSQNPTERDSLFLGFHGSKGYPILLPRDILTEHAHVLGDSGSGKTSLALSPMIAQLIRMAGRDYDIHLKDRSRETAKRLSSVVVIDLKGDLALFHGARDEAARAGLEFRYVTQELGLSTCAFNPLLQQHLIDQGPARRAEILLDALALSYGEGYGKSYFSRTNRRVLARLFHAHPQVNSFRELYPHTINMETAGRKRGINGRMADDAGELFAVIESLASFDVLNYKPEHPSDPSREYAAESVEQRMVDMNAVLDKPQVVYFYLPTSLGGDSAREIGKLALYSLLTAASHRETRVGPGNRVYTVIDEFQEIAADNLQVVLRQARSKNIGCILANQTISDLVSDVDLRPIVQGNTRFKQFFSATDLHQQSALVEASGETIDFVMGWSETRHASDNGAVSGESRSETETVSPRITRNNVITASDEPMQSIVHIPRGMGFAQFGGFPFVMSGEYHITGDWYRYLRDDLGWPQAEPGTITPIDAQMPDPEAAFGTTGSKTAQAPHAPKPESEKTEASDTNKPGEPSSGSGRSRQEAADIEQQLRDALNAQTQTKPSGKEPPNNSSHTKSKRQKGKRRE